MPARASALFISDLHLQEAHPRTTDAFLRFLAERAMAAEALYVLGDLFEYWAGDDDLAAPYHQTIVSALRAVGDAGVALYWIPGNRDFLTGPAFAQAAGLRALEEPHVAEIGGQRVALVHGDAECTDDAAYMAFRAQVRQSTWQAQFLAMPLAQRKGIIANLREGSREAHTNKSYAIMDVTAEAIDALFARTGADVIIHGHTHRPALHEAGGRRRYVLPDWDEDAEPERGGWIEIDAAGTITRRDRDGIGIPSND
ncbi:MAG: UDP-2,3-diacylglucosamine diphosphatase [Pseudomonadota bacterium]